MKLLLDRDPGDEAGHVDGHVGVLQRAGAQGFALGVEGVEPALGGRHRHAAADVDVLNQLAALEVAGGGVAMAIQADVSREEDVRRLFDEMIGTWGSIEILVANAGIQRDAPFHAMTLDQWNTVLAVNLTGQFLCAREAVREFNRRGVIPEVSCAAGKIISMSSVHDIIPWAGHVNYAASKAGMVGLTKSIAYEVASRGITVNCVAPGFITTAMTEKLTDDQKAGILSQVPAGRMGEPEEIAAAVLYLASPEAAYVTGTTLHVNGGMAML